LRELGALRKEQVWLTLGIGAVGYGGLFAVYTYLASTLMEVTHVGPRAVPVMLAIFGIGMTAGNLVVPRFADRALMPTAGALLLWSAVSLAFYTVAAGNIWAISLAVLAIGFGGALGPVLQTRLMDVAGEAQSLAAALNHSAFNAANALGPWLGGLAIAAGHGWTSTGWVGCGLALGGFAIWMISIHRLQPRRAGPAFASNRSMVGAAALALGGTGAMAGPPYDTDDPETTDPGALGDLRLRRRHGFRRQPRRERRA
jgi:DHA1 family inner membrane transport protein